MCAVLAQYENVLGNDVSHEVEKPYAEDMYIMPRFLSFCTATSQQNAADNMKEIHVVFSMAAALQPWSAASWWRCGDRFQARSKRCVFSPCDVYDSTKGVRDGNYPHATPHPRSAGSPMTGPQAETTSKPRSMGKPLAGYTFTLSRFHIRRSCMRACVRER